MSERSPEQEPQAKPLFDDCSNCEKRYQLTKSNSAVYHYNKQPECDFIFCICPHCSYRTRIFINDNTVDAARQNGINVVDDEDYADENIYSDWLDVKGIELPKTYELTPRHEELVRKLGETLLNCPDELLFDFLTDDYPRTLPERWI